MPIRPAAEADVHRVLELWREGTSVVSHTDDADGIRTLLARDPGALLLAEEDGRLVGTVIAAWDGWRAWVYRLVVAPGDRRRGIAGELVRHAERRLRHLGARRVAAGVILDHEDAVAFWEWMGYEHDAQMGRFLKPLEAESPPPILEG